MEMLLMGAVLSILGLAVSCLAFGAATREEPAGEKGTAKAAVAAPRFFAGAPALAAAPPLLAAAPPFPIPNPNRVPIEALLLQIENHVRLEQAAAECFLRTPNPALLHSRTISTMVN